MFSGGEWLDRSGGYGLCVSNKVIELKRYMGDEA